MRLRSTAWANSLELPAVPLPATKSSTIPAEPVLQFKFSQPLRLNPESRESFSDSQQE
jgi:hypothetical protein